MRAMILQELQGFCLPLLIETMLASVRLHQWSLAEEGWSGHTNNWGANTTLDQEKMQSTCTHKQQWHGKQWSLRLAVSKLAPQVLSKQDPLPSKKWWSCFPEVPYVSGRILSGAGRQDIWARASEPRAIMHPNGDLQSHSGSKHGDWGRAGTHILPTSGLDKHCTPCTDLWRQGQPLTQESRVGKPPGVVVCWILWVAVWGPRKLAP